MLFIKCFAQLKVLKLKESWKCDTENKQVDLLLL